MNPVDFINSLFEGLAGIAIFNHCRVLCKDKQLKGASVVSTIFMFSWGLWNLFYYPALSQWWSFFGGLSVTVANCLWLGLMFKYRAKPRQGDVRQRWTKETQQLYFEIFDNGQWRFWGYP